MRNNRADPIKIPASSSFIEQLNKTVDRFLALSLSVPVIMLFAFWGSLVKPKLIIWVPSLGTVYWMLVAIILALVYWKSAESARAELKRGLPLYGSLLVIFILMNIYASYEVIHQTHDQLFQRSQAALSFIPMVIPVVLWLAMKKIKVISSHEQNSNQDQ